MEVLLTFFQAVVQGICEIYPVSSAGHLVVFGVITETQMSFDTVLLLHFGSVIAIALFYGGYIGQIIAGKFGWKIPLMLLFSFLVTAIIGLVLENPTKELITHPISVARLWLLNALFLFSFAIIVRPGDRRISDLTFRHFLLIGLAQGFGTFPGISRLGITLGTALLCRMKWSQAVALSFILSVPVILAASLAQLFDLSFIFSPDIFVMGEHLMSEIQNLQLPVWSPYPHLFLVLVSFITSFFALYHISKIIYLGRRILVYFAVYCLVAGIFFPIFLTLF